MRKPIKTVLIALLILVLIPVLYVGGMILYAMMTDYKPPASEAVEIRGEALPQADVYSLRLMSWNIGFSGLGKESDFFYDGGKQVRMPKAVVDKNRKGIVETIGSLAGQIDFFLLQEVDLSSRRSFRANQVEEISAVLPGYAQAFGKNYDVNFVPVPFTNPMGGVLSGLSTWSRFQPAEATRYSFEGNYSFPNYLFFLDRCFLLERFPLPNGKSLVVINTHNSAYDDGTLKQKQMAQMKDVLSKEYESGNYVIAGGDWNQYPAGFTGVGNFPVKTGEAKLFVPEPYPEAGWKWAYDPTIPTNRELAAPFDADTTMRKIIDFFLVSPNVNIASCTGRDMGFEFSDHQPVILQVELVGLYQDSSSGEEEEN